MGARGFVELYRGETKEVMFRVRGFGRYVLVINCSNLCLLRLGLQNLRRHPIILVEGSWLCENKRGARTNRRRLIGVF